MRHEDLEQFFTEYEARMNRALEDPPEVDVEATAAAFAHCFVEASPVGVLCGKNDELFREAIPKGLAFYRSIGTRRMHVRRLDTTPIDELHAMARVSWRATFVKEEGGPEKTVDFQVVYFLQKLGGTRGLEGPPLIFAYITGDEEKALREHGLIPGSAELRDEKR